MNLARALSLVFCDQVVIGKFKRTLRETPAGWNSEIAPDSDWHNTVNPEPWWFTRMCTSLWGRGGWCYTYAHSPCVCVFSFGSFLSFFHTLHLKIFAWKWRTSFAKHLWSDIKQTNKNKRKQQQKKNRTNTGNSYSIADRKTKNFREIKGGKIFPLVMLSKAAWIRYWNCY